MVLELRHPALLIGPSQIGEERPIGARSEGSWCARVMTGRTLVIPLQPQALIEEVRDHTANG